MSKRISVPFTITRLQSVPTAYDAAGEVADEEAEDLDIDGEVSGVYVRAELDCGCSEGFEDMAFTTKDELGFVVDYDLTDGEAELAHVKLLAEYHGW